MPETKYAKDGAVHLAYQAVGKSQLDVVLVADWFGNVEVMWEGAEFARALHRLSGFSRLIVFDKRGTGLSDPVSPTGLPTLEEWIDDVRAVMDDAEIEQAALIGIGAGGPMVMQFAATHPHRVDQLVLVNTYARLASAQDYPIGIPGHVRQRVLEHPYSAATTADVLAGSAAGHEFRSWWARFQRQSVSPGTAAAMREMMFDVDVRPVLSAIHVPTLVLHRSRDPWIRIGHAHYLAEHIHDARLVELAGDEDLFFLGDADGLIDAIEEFLTGAAPQSRADRMLATLLFTDLVGSTATAARMGDRRWRERLDHHDAVIDRCLHRHRGRKIDASGDGVFAVFDGPGRAIGAARDIRDELGFIDLEVRAGIHTAEVEVRGQNVGGIAVHIGARIGALAGAGEILVSSIVRDLVVGSGITFDERGAHELKGVPGEWHLLAVNSS